MIFSITIDEAMGREQAAGTKEIPEAEKRSGATPGAKDWRAPYGVSNNWRPRLMDANSPL